jgi:hypothetical protein
MPSELPPPLTIHGLYVQPDPDEQQKAFMSSLFEDGEKAPEQEPESQEQESESIAEKQYIQNKVNEYAHSLAMKKDQP